MRRGLFVLFAVSALVAGSSSNGRAATSPCGTAASKFSGGAATGISAYGAMANITAYDPALCDAATGSPSTSSAWSMLVSHGLTYLAQTGYIRTGVNWSFTYANGVFHGEHYSVFTEWTEHTGGDNFQFWGAVPSSAKSETSYSFADQRINLWSGNTQLTHTDYDPMIVWPTPWEPQVFGETHHCESDVPGIPADHVTFSGVQKKSSDGTWSQINDLGLSHDCSSRPYHATWDTQPNSFDIWTTP